MLDVWEVRADETRIREEMDLFDAQLEMELDKLLALMKTKMEVKFSGDSNKAAEIDLECRKIFFCGQNSILLQLRFPLTFCDFLWEFTLAPLSVEKSALILRDEFLLPVLFTASNLAKRTSKLKEIIQQKDMLIQELRTQRSPSKRLLQFANPFDPHQFDENSKSDGMGNWVTAHDLWNKSDQSLYSWYMSQKGQVLVNEELDLRLSRSGERSLSLSIDLGGGKELSPDPTIEEECQSPGVLAQSPPLDEEVLSPQKSQKSQTRKEQARKEQERKVELKRKLERAQEREKKRRKKQLPKFL